MRNVPWTIERQTEGMWIIIDSKGDPIAGFFGIHAEEDAQLAVMASRLSHSLDLSGEGNDGISIRPGRIQATTPKAPK